MGTRASIILDSGVANPAKEQHMNILSTVLAWFQRLNLLLILSKLYPLVKIAIEEAANIGDLDGWTGAEKKAFAVKFVTTLAASTGVVLSSKTLEQLPVIVEFVYDLVFKGKKA